MFPQKKYLLAYFLVSLQNFFRMYGGGLVLEYQMKVKKTLLPCGFKLTSEQANIFSSSSAVEMK